MLSGFLSKKFNVQYLSMYSRYICIFFFSILIKTKTIIKYHYICYQSSIQKHYIKNYKLRNVDKNTKKYH